METPAVAGVGAVLPTVGAAIAAHLDVLTVGWLACAIPSPQDFSVFWHAERAVAEHAADAPDP